MMTPGALSRNGALKPQGRLAAVSFHGQRYRVARFIARQKIIQGIFARRRIIVHRQDEIAFL